MPKYKKIKKDLLRESRYVLCGSLDDIIGQLETIRDKHKNYSGLWMNVSGYVHRSYGSEHVEITVVITGTRDETDKERDKRLAKAKKARETRKKNAEARNKKKEDKERKEFERLKKKFEKAE